MRIKSYFAPAVEDAMAQARQELGEDAMLVRTRRAPAEARHLGEYEVIFAADVPGEPGMAEMPMSEATGSAVGDRVAAEISELKKELEVMRRTLARSAFTPAQSGGSADAASAYAALVAAEVSPELAREMVDCAEAPPDRGSDAEFGVRGKNAFAVRLAAEIEKRIDTRPELGRGEGGKIVALVGPPGAGKTTTLTKLAVSYGLAARRPTLLLSADTYRIGAAEQLRSYAAILGFGCQVLETATALAQALAENAGKNLILIDTPGVGAEDLDVTGGLARLLATRADIDTHLVLPASMKAADLSRAAAAFEIFAPRKLLFTRLDETGTFGPILNEAVRTGKALSFFAAGQRIPEDLEVATKRRLLELVLAGTRLDSGAARSAA